MELAMLPIPAIWPENCWRIAANPTRPVPIPISPRIASQPPYPSRMMMLVWLRKIIHGTKVVTRLKIWCWTSLSVSLAFAKRSLSSSSLAKDLMTRMPRTLSARRCTSLSKSSLAFL